MSAITNPIEYRRALGIRQFSPAWTAFTKALYGLPLDDSERPLWHHMADGIPDRPGVGWEEAFANVGRGGGKDDAIKTLINFECRFGGHEIAAAPGQRLPADAICPLREQAVNTIRMVQGEARLALNARYVVRDTVNGVEYANGTVARVQTADDVAVVGDTLCMLVLNEWALFPLDVPIESNARPALRRVTGAPRKRIIKISSSYTKDGDAWNCFRDHFGRESDILVVRGSTEFFNPNIDLQWLAKERRKLGPALAAMHFECEWLDAIREGFFTQAAREQAVQQGELRLPIVRTPVTIAADMSFSESSDDRVGWAVASTIIDRTDGVTERGTILHAAGGWKVDRSPRDMAVRLRDEVCVPFGTRDIIIDQYCDRTFQQLCEDVGIHATVVPWVGGDGEASKADRYRSFRTAMVDGLLIMPDIPELVRDITDCRSKHLPGGSERIEVPRSKRGHGDVLSAAILAATESMQSPIYLDRSSCAPMFSGNDGMEWGPGKGF